MDNFNKKIFLKLTSFTSEFKLKSVTSSTLVSYPAYFPLFTADGGVSNRNDVVFVTELRYLPKDIKTYEI